MDREVRNVRFDTADCLRVFGARTHNLRNISLDLPRDRLVVITGPSGSGKSSLAFDTIYAEGQRQYIESLSAYARQFLHQLERPDVDLIEGLQPTISIDQRAGSHNRRSTVATVTEIYDYLRLLYARLGEATCYQCGEPIRQQSPEQIQEALLSRPAGTRMMLLAPMVRGRKGQHRDVIETIRKAGFVRARIDGEVYDIADAPELAPQKNHHIEAVVDRIIVREGVEPRLGESIRLAVRHGDGLVLASHQAQDAAGQPQWHDELFSTEYSCPNCKISYEELEPRTFSFNSPYGACPVCEGLGVRPVADPGLERRLEKEQGAGGMEARRQRLETMREYVPCSECQGARLRPEARAVRLGGRAIHEATAANVSAARAFFASLSFPADRLPIAEPILGEITARLVFLEKVGLDYLTLDRPAETLSGGELQRVRLASGLGSGLVGVCYVLDEPSVGLHPRDNDRLIEALEQLRDRGNTVLVVEHDEAIMRRAEWLVDLGPGAGRHGGRIVAEGTPHDVAANPDSLTGRYLAGSEAIPVPTKRRMVGDGEAGEKGRKGEREIPSEDVSPSPLLPFSPSPFLSHSSWVEVHGARHNNLKNISVAFPLSALTCVTGVSGSGKSSLVMDTLSRALARQLGGITPKPGPHTGLHGTDQIDKVVEIDQAPVGRTPRSNPATYMGIFDEVRKVFAGTREARTLGYKAGRFSFNAKSGRCEECRGHGQRRIAMNFLPDLYVPCPACEGKRFNRQTLEIRYRGLTIADVLDLPVDDAAKFFENFPAIARLLASLQQVGLGYLMLGQSSLTLSGGEAQRIKLAAELGRVETGKSFYILDEPTTGLHFDDIKNLLAVLSRLVDLGNSVVVIEHNLDVIKLADWIIDMGPEGGEAGGYVLASGTPEQIAALEASSTGRYLRSLESAAGG